MHLARHQCQLLISVCCQCVCEDNRGEREREKRREKKRRGESACASVYNVECVCVCVCVCKITNLSRNLTLIPQNLNALNFFVATYWTLDYKQYKFYFGTPLGLGETH